ncbi:hypothetical protein SERLADRAFT_434190 [Serpula lacrymans var. lacrymans S7.9]|uniref:Reverse transcriptase domain-containing protein n=1 Tax=Serpula lacrymans var. lacrymans (strain S7.9) TaxID=578457 RepID=F8NJX9_SERL9|nr:uncharacterized protein SERLADRAFT_434190 [Serpula lacrymans var. lacrymans S7.9]EGO28291.1 hypothetical protein SERLADRAFT_434190 [Serpula lacrymans var. lacrymans S7.9]
MDVKVYMQQPEGFHQGGHNLVCQLNKAMGPSKEAGCGTRRCTLGEVRIILPVFVDDMTLASTSNSALDQAVKDLSYFRK